MHIDSYSFGSMTIDGKKYTSDVIVFPDKVKSDWWRREGHSLIMEDLEEVTSYSPDILIIGRGASGCMDIPLSTKEALEAKDIKLVDANTDAAYKLFNEEMEKGTKAVGAFHLTC